MELYDWACEAMSGLILSRNASLGSCGAGESNGRVACRKMQPSQALRSPPPGNQLHQADQERYIGTTLGDMRMAVSLQSVQLIAQCPTVEHLIFTPS
jgi:hypothetical protein